MLVLHDERLNFLQIAMWVDVSRRGKNVVTEDLTGISWRSSSLVIFALLTTVIPWELRISVQFAPTPSTTKTDLISMFQLRTKKLHCKSQSRMRINNIKIYKTHTSLVVRKNTLHAYFKKVCAYTKGAGE